MNIPASMIPSQSFVDLGQRLSCQQYGHGNQKIIRVCIDSGCTLRNRILCDSCIDDHRDHLQNLMQIKHLDTMNTSINPIEVNLIIQSVIKQLMVQLNTQFNKFVDAICEGHQGVENLFTSFLNGPQQNLTSFSRLIEQILPNIQVKNRQFTYLHPSNSLDELKVKLENSFIDIYSMIEGMLDSLVINYNQSLKSHKIVNNVRQKFTSSACGSNIRIINEQTVSVNIRYREQFAVMIPGLPCDQISKFKFRIEGNTVTPIYIGLCSLNKAHASQFNLIKGRRTGAELYSSEGIYYSDTNGTQTVDILRNRDIIECIYNPNDLTITFRNQQGQILHIAEILRNKEYNICVALSQGSVKVIL